MKKLLFILGLSTLTSTIIAQTTLYSDDFESTGTFIMSSTTSNSWTINNDYTGGTFLFGGILPVTIPNVPAQPVAISSQNGNYLHPVSSLATAENINCSSYSLGLSNSIMNAFMTGTVNTQGYENVTLNLWRTGGLNGVRIMYQVNGGGWQDSGHTLSGNVTGWQQESFIIPAGDDVAQFAIGFEFNETTAGDPAGNHYHSIDEISITGNVLNNNGDIVTTVTSPTNLTLCEGETILADYVVTEDQGTINSGNVYTFELSDATGSFAAPISIGTLTSTSLTGVISGTIPGGLSGTGYRVRVNASNDVMTGDDNGVDITINENPTIGAGVDQTICEGETATLTANNPDGALISWDNGVTDGVAFTPTVSDNYTVTATLNGCEATDEVTVTLTAGPIVDAGDTQIVCEGDEVTLTADNPDGANISWDGGVTDGVPFTATTTQNYEVTADLNGCTSTDIVQVTVVNAPATPTITLNGNGDLEVSISAGQTVEWYLDGVLITGQNSATLTPTDNGNYTAVVSEGNCSSEESDAFLVDFASIQEQAKELFVVYPNPTNGLLTLQGSFNELSKQNTIEVYDMNGRVVISSNFKTQINVQTLEKGIYYLKVSGIQQRVKFIKN
jgi:hypothetical protein